MGIKLYINSNHFEKWLYVTEEDYNAFKQNLDFHFATIYDYKTKKTYVFNVNDINHIIVEKTPFCDMEEED